MGKIKLRCKLADGVVNVKSIIKHPMLTGRQKDKETGETIPAHYIENVTYESNGKVLLTCNWGGSMSKNPYTAFTYKGVAGDKVKLTWKDNQGKGGTAEATIK